MPLDIHDLHAIFEELPRGHYASISVDGEILNSGEDHDEVFAARAPHGWTGTLFVRRPPNDNLWFV